MRAVLPAGPTRPIDDGIPRLGDWPDPVPGPGEVLLDVAAAGLNWADLLQLRGRYPPPPGASPIPGLECAGTIAGLGPGVEGWRRGDRVMALLAGGGHAERVAVPAAQVLPLPASLSWTDGAGLPEAGVTAWTNLVAEGGLQTGEAVLVTGATGGMGTMFVQLARALGARPIAAGRDPAALRELHQLGAEAEVLLDEELPERVRRLTGGAGADLACDLVGGVHFARALAALRQGGRLVLVGLLAGPRAEVDLGLVLRRRLRVVGSVLRSRPPAEKGTLVAGFAAFALPRLADGTLRPLVRRVVPLERVAEAYAALAAGGVRGKIVLQMIGGRAA
jgi:putative PIG3 family NAD(P)H quinone oxidoreductase